MSNPMMCHHYNIYMLHPMQLQPCKRGGPEWTRWFNLYMADPGNSCPANWTCHDDPVRGCGRKTEERYTCDSVLVPVNMKYSDMWQNINLSKRFASSISI